VSTPAELQHSTSDGSRCLLNALSEALSRVGSFGNKAYLQKAVEMFEDFLGKHMRASDLDVTSADDFATFLGYG
jgi:hypothetical protein